MLSEVLFTRNTFHIEEEINWENSLLAAASFKTHKGVCSKLIQWTIEEKHFNGEMKDRINVGKSRGGGIVLPGRNRTTFVIFD